LIPFAIFKTPIYPLKPLLTVLILPLKSPSISKHGTAAKIVQEGYLNRIFSDPFGMAAAHKATFTCIVVVYYGLIFFINGGVKASRMKHLYCFTPNTFFLLKKYPI
jgi:hypothetical protein